MHYAEEQEEPFGFFDELDSILNQDLAHSDIVIALEAYLNIVERNIDFVIRAEALMTICCALVESSLFEKSKQAAIEYIIDEALMSTRDLNILYTILYFSGQVYPFALDTMLECHMISKLTQGILTKESKNHRLFSEISLLSELCHLSKLSTSDTKLLDETLINKLLNIVEETQCGDESLNCATIQLILAINGQFMRHPQVNENTVIKVLGNRFETSKSFGENLLFMMNRGTELTIQLLILKLLYALFTNTSTYDYFYTNDLRVLVDVIIRELYNLPEEDGELRRAYLEVLPPLICNTQYPEILHKSQQIACLLEELTTEQAHKNITKEVQLIVEKVRTECASVLVTTLQ
ncbi:pre-rRNA processing [Basidiobolus ranarum]|uniref:Pre-rRNA processing n=1 Tax=Basidiobolus ranarum TaxID=34480 RepID=A0ABR2WSB7_9FUNG